MNRLLFNLISFSLILWMLTMLSCQHDPFLVELDPDPGNGNPPVDTTGTGNPVDTTGTPCDENTIYFQRDVLPILISNCAVSGCHDPATAEDNVILNNYNNVFNTAGVVPFNTDESDLIKVLYENDPDKVMPPPTQTPLQQEQVDLIEQWVLQGALDLMCDENPLGCDTIGVSFSATIFPLIQNKCLGCHSGNNPGGGYDFSTHNGVVQAVNDDRLLGAVNFGQGYVPMPQNGQKLSDCEISKIDSWINDGAPNN